MTTRIPSIALLKAQARRLREDAWDAGGELTHAQALEQIAHAYGYRDWNTVMGVAGNRMPGPPVEVGQRVGGHYLGQAFEGTVIGLSMTGDGRYHLTLHFDEPVDVVTFESFSAFRQRVNATIDPVGLSPAKTSNGRPQLQLRLDPPGRPAPDRMKAG
ncbi:hypothetical protein HDIA_3631 [Hartmannibacter diazotrophicus]|uniref:Glyoxalase-related protein domain-containing protein n=1 Tax=Hartmannibacter diazotrophicus TaxID=1482074 RepID=A0A2C9DA28_9HYPH|nr:glyoxalase superfamily protein [Hartmannibacter diazotrophicus]SON57172.1 hypothetical protein HDIA_3631 [Hartmannibacter diazotrophicus]